MAGRNIDNHIQGLHGTTTQKTLNIFTTMRNIDFSYIVLKIGATIVWYVARFKRISTL
jgi:hypothetical protein